MPWCDGCPTGVSFFGGFLVEKTRDGFHSTDWYVLCVYVIAILHLICGEVTLHKSGSNYDSHDFIGVLNATVPFKAERFLPKKIALVFSTTPSFIDVYQQWTVNNHCVRPFSAFSRQETGSSCLNDTIFALFFSCKQLWFSFDRFEDCVWWW